MRQVKLNGQILSIPEKGDEGYAEFVAATRQPATVKQIKVSEKGAVSVYGLQRFPVTLYAEQWETLLASAETIRAFIAANRSALKTKGV